MTALRIDTAQEKHPEFKSSIEDPNFESNVMSIFEDITLSDSPMTALDAAIKDGAQPNILRKNSTKKLLSEFTYYLNSQEVLQDVPGRLNQGQSVQYTHHVQSMAVSHQPKFLV